MQAAGSIGYYVTLLGWPFPLPLLSYITSEHVRSFWDVYMGVIAK